MMQTQTVTSYLILLILAVAHVSCGKVAPKKIKGQGALQNITGHAASKSGKCSSLNAKNFMKCCDSPIDDFFSKAQKLACNSKKSDTNMFGISKEYQMHKLTNVLNKISYKSKTTVAKFGKTVCLAECLFTNSELIADGAVDPDALGAFLAENLDEAWAEIVTTATTDCATSVETVTATTAEIEIQVKAKVTKICKLAPALILQCVIRAIGLACPTGNQIMSTACDNVRTSFTNCDPFASDAAAEE